MCSRIRSVNHVRHLLWLQSLGWHAPVMSGTRNSGRRRGATRRVPRIKPAVFVAAGAALALVAVGGGTAYAMDDSVTLDNDGEQQTVHTFGGTVQDVLDSAGVTLGED